MLLAIQSSIKYTLDLSAISGVFPEDLDCFKKEFRTSAFTCRCPNCPRAALGFPDEKLQFEHETRHTQRINCAIVDCPYPPFVSTRALKEHMSKCHQPQSNTRKRIRRGSRESYIQKPEDSEMLTVLPRSPFLDDRANSPTPSSFPSRIPPRAGVIPAPFPVVTELQEQASGGNTPIHLDSNTGIEVNSPSPPAGWPSSTPIGFDELLLKFNSFRQKSPQPSQVTTTPDQTEPLVVDICPPQAPAANTSGTALQQV